MLRKGIAVPLVVLLLMGLGCSDKSTGPEENDPVGEVDDFAPVAPGVTYEYDVSGYDIDRQCTWVGTYTISCLGETTHVDGFDVFDLLETEHMTEYCGPDSFTYTDTEHAYFRVTSTEVLEYDDLDYEYGTILLQEPLAEGESWQPFPEMPVISTEITDGSATITVPAGTFTDCLVTETTSGLAPGYLTKVYYAPDVGPVKFILSRPSDHEEQELTSYSIP